MPTPPTHADLERHSDADLVALARAELVEGEAGLAIAKRCVALVYERRRSLVRAMCAGKAKPDIVDDLEASVYERFVRTVYLGREAIVNPAGLLVTMSRRVIANHYDRRPGQTVPLDEVVDRGIEEEGYDELAIAQAVDGLLATLSERQREVVSLRIEDGLTSVEIARRLDTTAGNVDVIFFRAMRALREAAEK